jgi:tetratricopeptide (TPR) repeat protein
MTVEGGGSVRLPETVQGIIAARLDGLDALDKALLQDAAVLGKVFWRGGAAAIGGRETRDVERGLHELERRQIVRRERHSSVASEVEYSFWHLLVRDVAYGQIPRAARAEKHRLAAEWTASLSVDRLTDRADLLAHHYLAAVELAQAAGRPVDELEQPARRALRAAGDRAFALSSFQPAIRFYREALALWPDDDPDRPRLLLSLGRAIFSAEDTGEEPLSAARDALVAAGDLEGAAEAETLLGEHAWIRNRTQETAERLERAVRLVEDRPLSRAKAYVAGNVSRFAMLAGNNAVAIEKGREALAMAEQLGLEELRAFALNNVGTARVASRDVGGIQDLEEAIAITARIGSVEAIRAHINLASVLGGLGDMRRCREVHERGFALAKRFGQVRGIRFLSAELALDAYSAGEWDDAGSSVDAFVAEVEAGSPHYMASAAWSARALLRLARDDADGATADLARAVESAREADEPQILLPILSGAAFVRGELGRHNDARAAVGEIVSAASDEPRLDLWVYPAVHVFDTLGMLDDLRALLAADSTTVSRWAEAARRHLDGDLAGAADILNDIGSLPDEARTRLTLAEQLAAAGRRADADAELARAVAFYRSVGATFYLRRAERVLAASA